MTLACSIRSRARRLWRRPLRRWTPTCEGLESRLALTGELTFAEPIALPTGMNPEAITVADLDRDGRLDLVTADFADSTVTVHYGKGGGQFAESRHHFVGQGPVAVIAADLDGQHGLDLITANTLTGDVSVLLSRGVRAFEEEVPYETGEFTEGVSVVDLSGDGMLDLLVAVAGVEHIGQLAMLMGDPTAPGEFLPPVSILEKWGVNSVVTGRFDENDTWDLALASHGFGDNDVAVLLQAADGGFGPAVSYQAGWSPDQILTADLNGDAHLDLVANNSFSYDVSVFLGRGDGTFGEAESYADGLADGDVVVADVDGDGYLDLVTAGGGNRVSVLPGRGDGTFEAPVSFFVDAFPTGVAVADFDGDGRLDLAACTRSPSTVQLLLSTTEPVVELMGAGGTYVQDFDAALGTEADVLGTDLPAGWTAVIEGNSQRQISQSYPPDEPAAGAYNVGLEDDNDRALALGDEGSDALSQLQLAMEVTDEDLYALTLAFDLEVWAGDPAFVVEAGEAAFQATIQSKKGSRWVPLANLGVVSTGPGARSPPTRSCSTGTRHPIKCTLKAASSTHALCRGLCCGLTSVCRPAAKAPDMFTDWTTCRFRPCTRATRRGTVSLTPPIWCTSFRRASTRMRFLVIQRSPKVTGMAITSSSHPTWCSRSRWGGTS